MKPVRVVVGGGAVTKPNCFNRPAYKDTVEVQDGWRYVTVLECFRAPNMITILDPMSKTCQQHSPHGAATIYGWDCEGCKHEPAAPRE